MSNSRPQDEQTNKQDQEPQIVSQLILSDKLIPKGIIDNICSYLPNRDLGRFFATSKQSRLVINDLQLVRQALEPALHATPAPKTPSQNNTPTDTSRLAVIDILRNNSELFFRKNESIVTDHYQRKCSGSIYSLLLGTGDVWAIQKIHEAISIKATDTETDKETKAQYAAQAGATFRARFPACPWPIPEKLTEDMLYDDRNKKQIANVKAKLNAIVAAINNDPCTNGEATQAATRTAVAALCAVFKAYDDEVIKTGLHFPLGILQEIFRVYHENRWNWSQRSYFSRTVIGATEDALSAVDGQCIKHGLKNLDAKQGPDRTDGLFCPNPQGIPKNKLPFADMLGNTCFVDPYDGESCFRISGEGDFEGYMKNGWWSLARSSGRAGPRTRVLQLIENKSRSYWELLCSRREQCQHTQVSIKRKARK